MNSLLQINVTALLSGNLPSRVSDLIGTMEDHGFRVRVTDELLSIAATRSPDYLIFTHPVLKIGVCVIREGRFFAKSSIYKQFDYPNHEVADALYSTYPKPAETQP